MTRALLCLLLVAVPAFAAPAKSKVLIDAPKPIAALITKAVKPKHNTGLISLADEPTGGDVKNACLDQAAVAVITARQAGDTVSIMVLNGADGSPLGTFKFKWGKKPPKVLPKINVATLLLAIGEGKLPKAKPAEPVAPPPEKEKPAEATATKEKPPEPVAEKPAEPEKHGRHKETTAPPPPPPVVEEPPPPVEQISTAPKPQALRLGIGVKVFTRRFGYTDDIFQALSTYKLPAGPAIVVDADLYPAAFFTRSFAANIGVLFYYDEALGISSKGSDGTKYGTNALDLKTSLTVRIPVASVLQFNPFVGFTRQTFGITSSTGVKPNIPTVGYNGIRAGLMGRIKLIGPVSLQLSFAGQFLLKTGEIGMADYFPHSKTTGLDAQVAIPVAIGRYLEIKLQGDYTRFWSKMNPNVGDPWIAGGALDVYASGTLVVAFTL